MVVGVGVAGASGFEESDACGVVVGDGGHASAEEALGVGGEVFEAPSGPVSAVEVCPVVALLSG